jgi:diacylglycerol O-acyltransferase / wax synthase
VRDEVIGAPQSSLNGPMSGMRHFATMRFDLAEVKAVKTRLGGTVNDVVLALCAGDCVTCCSPAATPCPRAICGRRCR